MPPVRRTSHHHFFVGRADGHQTGSRRIHYGGVSVIGEGTNRQILAAGAHSIRHYVARGNA